MVESSFHFKSVSSTVFNSFLESYGQTSDKSVPVSAQASSLEFVADFEVETVG
jgi:hypothetical protein